MKRMRVVVCEDTVLLRESMTMLLRNRGLEVVAAVATADALLEVVETRRPDVVLVDIRLPPGFTDEGLQAVEALGVRAPEVGALVLSHHVDLPYAMRLLHGEARGRGYLLKDRLADIGFLLRAIGRVSAGGCVVDPALVDELLRTRTTGPGVTGLSPRELEILGLMAEGRSNQAIGARLFLSERTVEAHVRKVFSRLGLAPAPDDHRRVLAVLAYLRSRAGVAGPSAVG